MLVVLVPPCDQQNKEIQMQPEEFAAIEVNCSRYGPDKLVT